MRRIWRLPASPMRRAWAGIPARSADGRSEIIERVWIMAKLENATVAHAHLKTPRAAAIAGIVFSLLMFAIFWLLRRSIPADPLESGSWLAADTGMIKLALNLVPLAGVAFLWFIGVLRDRLGRHEDRFFATVFLGSGLLFLAMLFL